MARAIRMTAASMSDPMAEDARCWRTLASQRVTTARKGERGVASQGCLHVDRAPATRPDNAPPASSNSSQTPSSPSTMISSGQAQL